MPETEPFLFSRPEDRSDLSSAANAAVAATALGGRIVREEREHCDHSDGRPENVAEHSYTLAIVALELSKYTKHSLDLGLVAQYVIVHDLVEAYAGDTPTHNITAEGRETKEQLEAMALGQLALEYGEGSPIVKLARRYESQTEKEARYVRMVDKLMPLLICFHDSDQSLWLIRTPKSLQEYTINRVTELIDEYPDFEDIIKLKLEIATALISDRMTHLNG